MAKSDRVQQIQNCCREVRLGAVPCKVGDRLDGWNTVTDEYEEWVVVEVCHEDNWRSLVKRVN